MTPSDYVRLVGGILVLALLGAAALVVTGVRRGVRNLELETRELDVRALPPVSEWDRHARPAPRPGPSGRVRIDPGPAEPAPAEPYRCASTLDHAAHRVQDAGTGRYCAGRRSGPRRFRV